MITEMRRVEFQFESSRLGVSLVIPHRYQNQTFCDWTNGRAIGVLSFISFKQVGMQSLNLVNVKVVLLFPEGDNRGEITQLPRMNAMVFVLERILRAPVLNKPCHVLSLSKFM
jgi:hypothetical protein